jgi:hypothetical protein
MKPGAGGEWASGSKVSREDFGATDKDGIELILLVLCSDY